MGFRALGVRGSFCETEFMTCLKFSSGEETFEDSILYCAIDFMKSQTALSRKDHSVSEMKISYFPRGSSLPLKRGSVQELGQ